MAKIIIIKSITKHIPNFLTCLNLLCGCIAIILIFQNEFTTAAYLVFAAAVIDFFDGFAARILRAYSAIGKDLDSLADMVTFGVVPGLMMYALFLKYDLKVMEAISDTHIVIGSGSYVQYFSLIISVFSALRLAKFNNDTRQSESFIGLPTPANAMLICSLPFILEPCLNMQSENCSGGVGCYVESLFLNPWLFVGFCCLMSYLLVAEQPLFSLKFKTFGFKGNEIRYVMIAASIILFATLKFAGFPVIIFLYILLSIINNFFFKKENKTESN